MPDVPAVLRVLVDTAVAIVRRSSSGQAALARAADVVDPLALPAALRGDVAPALAAAREEACAPLDSRRVEGLLRDAWGRPPARELDDLDPEPIAVRAASQVHRGERDGRLLAVKVLRPGLRSAVRNDLALLDALAPPLAALLPDADVGDLLREGREAALDELDLEHEGAGQRLARRALRGVEEVVVPATHGELTTETVLVSDLLAGPTLADEPPAQPPAVARALLRAHLAALTRAGLALTDPRPGHVVLLADGRVGLLGTGVSRPADRGRVRAALRALAALRAADGTAFAAALGEELELLPPDVAAGAHPLIAEVAGPLGRGPGRLDAPEIADGTKRALALIRPLLEVVAAAHPRAIDLGTGRMAIQLTALLARLEVTADWLPEVAAAASADDVGAPAAPR